MVVRIYEALRRASSFLRDHDLEEPAGEWLLRHHTGMNRAQLLASMHDQLDSEKWKSFWSDVQTLATGVPVQHLIGHEEFYGRLFRVNQHVLIPRPETEELVALMLGKMPSSSQSVLDIGTGSGAIAVSLKLERPDCSVKAIDLSEEALAVAEENAQALGAEISFMQGDLFFPVTGHTFDVIVSNPPYIPETDKESLAVQVRDFEPVQALFAGMDGLEIYRRLANEAPAFVKPSSIIGLEVGSGQGLAVKALFEEAFPNAHVEIHYDINGKDRMVVIHVDMRV